MLSKDTFSLDTQNTTKEAVYKGYFMIDNISYLCYNILETNLTKMIQVKFNPNESAFKETYDSKEKEIKKLRNKNYKNIRKFLFWTIALIFSSVSTITFFQRLPKAPGVSPSDSAIFYLKLVFFVFGAIVSISSFENFLFSLSKLDDSSIELGTAKRDLRKSVDEFVEKKVA